MAYRTIANSEVSVDAPVDNALMVALRDNCSGIAQGLSGAPKIARIARDDSFCTEAIQSANFFDDDQAGTNAHPIASVLSVHQTAEENIIHSIQIDNGNVFTLSGADPTPDIDSQDYIFRRAGTYTLRLFAAARNGAESISGRVYIENSLIFTGATTNKSRYDFLNVTVDAGDTLKLNLTGSTSSGTWFFGRVHLVVYSSNSFAETCGIGQFTKYENGVTHSFAATKYGIT